MIVEGGAITDLDPDGMLGFSRAHKLMGKQHLLNLLTCLKKSLVSI